MRFSRVALALFTAVSLVAAPLAAREKLSRQIPVDKRFAKTDEIKFTGTPKGYSFRWAVIAPAGVIEFCGVGSGGDIARRSAYDQIRQKMQLEMNGKVIHRGVQFFARVNSVKKLDKAVANCISTGVKVPAKRPDIRLTLDRGRVKG